jgi:DNA-binding HxlR family transcriptional regulator
MNNYSSSTKTTSCVAQTTQIIGDKWTPLVVNALSDKTLRFCELQTKVNNLNPRTLSARLDRLEDNKIINKKVYAEVPPRVEYSLTNKGRDLLPILESMANWGDRYHKDVSNA